MIVLYLGIKGKQLNVKEVKNTKSPKPETIQMSSNERVGKQIVIYSNNKI